MRYHVDFLAGGNQETTTVEADDAAAAAAAVQGMHPDDGFELLAVVLDTHEVPATEGDALQGAS